MIDLMPEVQQIIELKNIKPHKLNTNSIIEDKSFTEFIIKINSSLSFTNIINSNILLLSEKRKSLPSITNIKEVNSSKEEINLLIDKTKQLQDSIKSIIYENESFVKQTKAEDSYYSRVVSNMYTAVIKKLDTSSSKFNTEQSLFKDFLKKSIVREAEMATERRLTDKEKEEIIQNPSLIQDLIRKKLEGEAHVDLINKVNQLESRHKDILKLEKSIEQMYKMFKDLEILVKSQGEIIENVEKNILNAKEYTFKAELEINKADDYLKAARKKKIIILVVVLVVFIIIGGITLKIIL